MPIYYPQVVCNLIIRFDESLLNGTAPSPKTATQGANTQVGGPGEAVKRAGLLDGAADRLTVVTATVPTQASFELPTFRQAPKFNLAFNFRDFPLDPRVVRALGVEIYVGTVTGDAWARGMRGVLENGRLASQLPLSEENLMLAGVADSINVEHGERGSNVTIEGKGLQGLFLAAKVSAAQLSKLDMDQPINAVVAQLLAMDAQGASIPIRISGSDWPTPFDVPKPAAQALVSRINQGANGSKTTLPMRGNPHEVTVWDVITNLCNLVGAVPYFSGHELWIRPARSIYEQLNAAQRGQTPFKGGRARQVKTANGSVSVNFRKMVYGRNLLRLSFDRKYGPTSVPAVRVVSVDTSSKRRGKDRLLEVVVPEDAEKQARTTAVDPSGRSSRTEIVTVSVPGITDKTRLREIATQLREEYGRGEIGGTASSKDLASLGGDNEDADIIRLRPGDAVEFLVDASGVRAIPPVVSELNTQSAMSTKEAVDAVAARLGGRRDLAEALVGTARGTFVGLQNVFRVHTVKYTWGVDKGLAVDFDFHNYLQVRNDLNAKAEQPSEPDYTSSVTQSHVSSVRVPP